MDRNYHPLCGESHPYGTECRSMVEERERQDGPDCRAEYNPRTHTLDHFECDPMRCVDRVFLFVGD